MKRLLLLLLLGTAFFGAKAQISVDIAYLRALNNTTITTSGTPIHKTTLGSNLDTTLGEMLKIYNAISTAGNLQAVTAVGSNTTIPMWDGTGTLASLNTGALIGAKPNILSPTPITGPDLQVYVAGIFQAGLDSNQVQLKSFSNNFRTHFAGAQLSGERYIFPPDEGAGNSVPTLGATQVLHTTKDPITVGNTATDGTVYTTSQVTMYHSGTPIVNLANNGVKGVLTMNDLGHGGGSVLFPDSSSSNNINYEPHSSGTLVGVQDTVGGTGLGVFLTPTSGVTPAGVQTLTNKTTILRDSGAVDYTSAVTYNIDKYDRGTITALAHAITISFSGTPTRGQCFVLEIWDNGSTHNLTFSGGTVNTVFGTTVAAPSATIGSTTKPLFVEFVAAKDGKLHAQGVNQE